jgi:hypothetical protein
MTVAASGLSVGEFAEVAGTCVAVAGLAISGVGVRIRKLKRRVRKCEADLRNEAEKRAMLSVVAERGLAGTINSLDFLAGLVQRSMSGRAAEVDQQECMRLFSGLRASVERSWEEARLMAGEEAAQRSALQQLTNRLADEGTIGLLNRGADVGGFGSLESSTLLAAADEIDKRSGSSA